MWGLELNGNYNACAAAGYRLIFVLSPAAGSQREGPQRSQLLPPLASAPEPDQQRALAS